MFHTITVLSRFFFFSLSFSLPHSSFPLSEQVLRDGPDQAELLDVEAFEEVDALGKALLDRLTVPVIFPDG